MNDKAVTSLGKIYKNNLNAKEEWELYAENMFPDSPHLIISPVFIITRTNETPSITYSHTDIRPYDQESYREYGYRKGASNGGDVTVSTKFGSFEDTTTFKNKKIDTILKDVFGRVIELADEPEKEVLELIRSYWRENYLRINKDIYTIYQSVEIEKRFKCGLSIIAKIDGEEYFVSSFNAYKRALVRHATDGLSEFLSTVSEGYDSVCSICTQKKDKLHGFASPFKYFTVDKKGYLPNYFNLKLAWKNYPICSDCAADFYLGSRLIDETLRFYFYGRSYMAVPRVLIEDSILYETVYNIFKDFRKLDGDTKATYEDALMLYMAEQKNQFNLDMLFYEENKTTGAIKIKAHIEEIFPSRFRKIFVEARDFVDTHKTFEKYLTFEETVYDKESKKKKEQKEQFKQRFRFAKLLQFFDKDDYSIIQAVFDGENISLQGLYTAFMNFFRANYRKILEGGYSSQPRKVIIDAISVLYYLDYLKLITIEKPNYEVKMEQEIDSSKKESSFDTKRLQQFISDNPVFFDRKYKVGLYTLGLLVQLVMNTQQASLRNTPFEKKLKGYKISGADVENIYVEALNKLQQYHGAYAYGNLRKFMTEYFNLEINEIMKAPSAEISFYFVSGMETQFLFKSITETGVSNE